MSSPSSPGGLLRVLGLITGLAITFGGIVSLGILRAPGEVAAQLPDPWWYMATWIAAGVFVIFSTASATELATALPRAGAYYVYAHRTLGPFVGFVSGWTDWLNWCGATAMTIIVINEYLHLLSASIPRFSLSLCLAIAVSFAVIQWRGVKWGTGVHNVASMIKAVIFAVLIIACFVLTGGEGSEVEAAALPTMPMGWAAVVAFIVALRGVLYAYDGWVFTAYFSEEMEDPGRTIPRSMFMGVGIVIAVYLLINIAVLRMLPMSEIVGAELAVGRAVEAVFGPLAETLITAFVTGFMIVGINLGYMFAARVIYAMSTDGLFFRQCRRVNKGGTPTVALLASLAATIIFLLFSGSFVRLVEALAFFTVVNYAILFLSVFILRRKEPDLPRPYRAWGYPWTTALTLAAALAFLAGNIIGGTGVSLTALVVVVLSYPLYLLFRRINREADRKETG
ncbi:MAG: APC family permease [Gemmatimonadetes bacterium]|nr:APC family permease [Gemmatimonadota bacterium]